MDLPDGIRKRLEDFSRNVLFDQSGTRTVARENDTFLPHGKLRVDRTRVISAEDDVVNHRYERLC